MFVVITEKTGWTPQQISSLTLAQISEYFHGWTESAEQSTASTPGEIAMFNLSLEAGNEQ